MSCGILMPKYVITALLAYFIQYKKLARVGVIMLKKQFFRITEFRETNVLAFFHHNSFTEAK